ncbi:MAG TPA: 1-acyl-sn-glycerol-3-phosphate acyltransferase, partial [Gammaproteobacteria bacterium]|nr:1-acyl-sn-glycerol-3-phosphate acyltransferase [Gammaproteobacteria bacterium]
MFGHLNLLYPCNSDVDPISNYHKLAFVFVVGVSMYALTKLAESDQHHFDNRATRVFAGLLLLLTRMLHTRNDDLEIKDAKNKLITAGPHRTGWEALVVASKIKGTPPRFLATDAFNFVPGVSQFMTTFKTIPVKYTREKNETGRPANADAVTLASQALNEDGCVVLFPQGNFSR